MVFELVAVVVAGFAGAGILLAVGMVFGQRVPRWLVPLGAALAMLVAAISSEYGWYSRTAGALPESVVVAETVEARRWWRPWTFAVPMTERFVALDTETIRDNAEQQGLYLADFYFFGRWQPVQTLQVMVDCQDNRRAAPSRDESGEPAWRDVGADDPVLSSVCTRV